MGFCDAGLVLMPKILFSGVPGRVPGPQNEGDEAVSPSLCVPFCNFYAWNGRHARNLYFHCPLRFSSDYITDKTMQIYHRTCSAIAGHDRSITKHVLRSRYTLPITLDVFRSQPRATTTRRELRSQDMYLDNRKCLTITAVVFRSHAIFCNHKRRLAIAGYAFRT